MVGTVTLGLVGGLIASKMLFRARYRRARCGAGGHARRWHGPGGRWRRGDAGSDGGISVQAPPAPVDSARLLDARLAPLELSQRQAEEAREAFADVAAALGATWRGWSGLPEALAAVGSEPFDRARAAAALGELDGETARHALDALEHVHNILTPEQRDQLS
jgi:hypothetical protein